MIQERKSTTSKPKKLKKIKSKIKAKAYVGNETEKRDLKQEKQIQDLEQEKKKIEEELKKQLEEKQKEVDSLKQVIKIRVK